MSSATIELLRIAPDDARADERMRIHIGVAEKLVAARMDLRTTRPVANALSGVARGVDFVAEYPGVAGANAAIFTAFELEYRHEPQSARGARRRSDVLFEVPYR